MPEPERLLTVPDVADYLSLSVRQVWRLVSKGHLDVVRIGHATRIRESVLNDYITSLTTDPFRRVGT